MKKVTLLLVALITQLGSSQSVLDYKNAPSTKGANYFEIVEATRAELIKKHDENPTRSNLKSLKHFERWAYEWKDKVHADGTFPSSLTGWNSFLNSEFNNTSIPGKKLKNNNKYAIQSQEAASALAPNWIQSGPTNNVAQNGNSRKAGLGRLNSIVLDPDNENTIYVGAPVGGFWKSTDAGQNWSPKTDDLAGLGVTEIKVHPDDSNTIFFASGDFNGSGISSTDIFISTNKGETWAPTNFRSHIGTLLGTSGLALSNNFFIGDLEIIPANGPTPARIGVTFLNLFVYSDDNGATWNQAFVNDGNNQTAVKLNDIVRFPNNIMFISDSRGGVYVSTNSGASFTEILPNTGTGNITVLATSAASPDKLYIYRADGRYISVDYGTNPATQVSFDLQDASMNPSIDAQGGYNLVMLPSQTNPGEVLLGGVNGWKLTENPPVLTNFLDAYFEHGGSTNFFVHADHHAFIYGSDNTTVYNGNDGGIYKGSINADANTPWEDITDGLVITQSYNVAITEQDENYLMMANQDNDSFAKTTDGSGGYVWNLAISGDGVGVAIDYNNHLKRYTGAQRGRLIANYDGYTTAAHTTILPATNTAAFISPLEIHPTDPNLIYRGYGGVARVDFTDTNNVQVVLFPMGLTNTSYIELGQNGPSAPLALYAVGTNVAIRSLDGGTTFSTLSSPSAQPFVSFSVKQNTLGNVGGETLYASVSGYVDGEKIYKSTDGGSTWSNISLNLPNLVVKEVFVHQTDVKNTLFVATEIGMFTKDDDDTQWSRLGTGLPNTRVQDFKFNYTTNTLYAATFGRGLWSVNFNTLSTSDFSDDNVSNLNIYPNPVTNGEFTVELEDNFIQNNKADYIIYNYLGAIVKKGTLNNIKSTINTNGLQSSTYILQVTSGSKTITKKLVVN